MAPDNAQLHAAPRALTIAGFDPSGGAGVLADVRTFIAFGCLPSAVITSITFQNDAGVFGATHQDAETVRRQMMPLLQMPPACVKTGMMPTREVVNEVARLFRETNLPAAVVDPVMVSSSGDVLMEDEAVAAAIEQLFPLARVVTPNVPEAERISGLRIDSENGMRTAAATIRRQGARSVLIKGGHLKSDPQGQSIDVLDNDGEVTVFRNQRIPHVELHGTGCMMSAAIAAGLGRGLLLEDAVARAKRFVYEALLQKS